MEQAVIVSRAEATSLGRPNRLLYRDIENIVAMMVAPKIASTPLSKGLPRQARRPVETRESSQESKPIPATATSANCLLISSRLVVQGSANNGIKKTPIRSVHLIIIAYRSLLCSSL